MRLVIPPVTNDFIALFKDSSIVSVITMVELTKVYGQLAATYYDYIGAGILTAAIYFLMGLPFVRLARWAENRLATDKRVVTTTKKRWLGVGSQACVTQFLGTHRFQRAVFRERPHAGSDAYPKFKP